VELNNKIAFLSAHRLVEKIKRKEIRSESLLELYIERYNQHNSKINAIVATDLDNARKRARQADEALARGEDWGPLHGLPLTIKDTFEVVGMPTVSGAPGRADYFPEQNAVAVQRYIDAGAVVFGKTNCPLMALDWQSYNEIYGTTNNPWDFNRTPGGSSGGAAAALATGLTPLELGSDMAGSIRIPSHFCGIYGHKPTHGIVPIRGHIPGLPGAVSVYDIAVAGPMARCAEDLEMALEAIAGPNVVEEAGWSLDLKKQNRKRLKDFKVAYWFDDEFCTIDTEMQDRYETLISQLKKTGVSVEQILPVKLSEIRNLFLSLMFSGFGTEEAIFLSELGALKPLKFLKVMSFLRGVLPLPKTLKKLLSAFFISHSDWLDLHEAREKLRHKMLDFFGEYDVLLLPVVPLPAFPHLQKGDLFSRKFEINGRKRPYSDLMTWISLAGVLGLPATSAPIAQCSNSLPMNIQIVGGSYQDLTTIKFAQLLPEVMGGFVQPDGC